MAGRGHPPGHSRPALPERERIFEWAEPGKTTVMFALESYRWSHTYIDSLWYASTTTDWQFWQVSHGEPILLRTYSGKPERLMSASTAILAGQGSRRPLPDRRHARRSCA